MKKVFKNTKKFVDTKFSDCNAVGHLQKCKEEIEEAIKEPSNIYEYVDCLLCILAAAAKAGFSYKKIKKASKKKLKINNKREWVKYNGVYQHKEKLTEL